MTFEIKPALLALSLLVLGGIPAGATPGVQSGSVTREPGLVQYARSDCRWVDNKWTYERGDRRLVCRPDRPSGRDWGWRREGNRAGWYNRNQRVWHFNGW
jgi:hypothetical protein